MNKKLIKLNYRRKNSFYKKKRKKLPQISFYHSNTIEHSLKQKNCNEILVSSAKNPNVAKIFQNPHILAFLRKKILRDIIGTKLIETGKVKRKFTKKIQGKCTPCLANNRSLSCKQVVHTRMFRSNQTNRIFQIYHSLNCKSKYVIYLLECTKCRLQQVGKAETEFNNKLNNHQKDVGKPDAIPGNRHFSGKNHNFITHAKFILIEQICNIDMVKEKN